MHSTVKHEADISGVRILVEASYRPTIYGPTAKLLGSSTPVPWDSAGSLAWLCVEDSYLMCWNAYDDNTDKKKVALFSN